ncbi:MAG TPA: group II intron reverse transcriptase/maturase [Methylomirabilota bacterium]|nr:group II intron reverse transcriptase/maturase [Methylomirabilota bacterium]
MNAGAPWPAPKVAEERVLGIQRKLHKWAQDDQDRRFKDLHNLVCDRATLIVAWRRVRANRGSRSAGVDGQSAAYVEQVLGVERFLAELREELRSGSYRPLPVRKRMIPKRGGKLRRLGIATVRDRVAQAALKLVLEPIFEVDFEPCSYGFRPERRAQDAIAEVHFFTARSYEWIVEADIEACFERLDHVAIADGVKGRIADKRVLRLVKAFLKAGIMSEHGGLEAQLTGTPQGGILSPLMSNIALSALDRHYARAWEAMGDTTERKKRRRHGEANYRLVRYADDFVICVAGDRRHAEALVAETEQVIRPLGLTLSGEKTRVTHIDEGIEFLGWRIKRQRGRDRRPHVYTYPSKRSLAAVMAKVKQITRSDYNQPLAQLLHRLNPVLRGWCAYFRSGVSSRTFNYLRAYTWRRVVRWLRRKHRKASWRWLRRHYLPGWWPTHGHVVLFNPGGVRTTRYRYRGTRITTPWERGKLAFREPTLPLERLDGLIAR